MSDFALSCRPGVTDRACHSDDRFCADAAARLSAGARSGYHAAMQMSGEHRVAAPRERVWAALNDPEVLRQAIPGCEQIERTAENEFTATVKAKVGPVSARFSGFVRLSDLDPPRSYKISGEGKGGAAGFAKGGATVRLEEAGDATVLRYDVDAQVGGKLAQIGSRLIDGTARKLAGEFFANFAAVVGGPAEAAAPAPPAPAEVEKAAPGLRPVIWVTAVIAAVLVLLILFAFA